MNDKTIIIFGTAKAKRSDSAYTLAYETGRLLAQAGFTIANGGYVLRDCDGEPEAIIIATGSEVELAVGAYDALSAKGRKVRVVSMPSTDAFDAQDAAYKESVLPTACTARVAVEAGVTGFWMKYVGLNGQRPTSHLLDLTLDLVGLAVVAPVVDGHVATFSSQGQSHRGADTHAAAGDDGALSLETQVHVLLLRLGRVTAVRVKASRSWASGSTRRARRH